MIQCDPQVKILADSYFVDMFGTKHRITTFELMYWRSIHSELMTHRVFSRSARSSRAVPIEKMIDQVAHNPWGPKHWTKNCKGMQAQEEITDPKILNAVKSVWEQTAKTNALLAKGFTQLGLHKQDTNRILEPYTYISVVLTATDFDNFFTLRCSPMAQPEMQDLANAMKKAYEESEPKKLKENEWHLPYLSEEDLKEIESKNFPFEFDKWEFKLGVSAARCARVSYKAFDGTTDLQKDFDLFQHLRKNKHLSPMEHQATPDYRLDSKRMWGNLNGFKQFRKWFDY